MSKKSSIARAAAVIAVAAGLVLPLAAPTPAQAWWRGGWGPGWGYGWRPGWGYGWRGGIFFAPPVVLRPPVYAPRFYGPPVYVAPPPVYYGPSAYYPAPVVSGGSPYNPAGGASGYGQHPTQ